MNQMESEKMKNGLTTFPLISDSEELAKIDTKAEKCNVVGGAWSSQGDSSKNKRKSLKDCQWKYKHLEKMNSSHNNKFRKWPWIGHIQDLNDSVKRLASKSNVSCHVQTFESFKTFDSSRGIAAESQVSKPLGGESNHMSLERVRASEECFGDARPIVSSLETKNVPKRRPDHIDHLFMSYAATFRRFMPKRQAKLKIDMATLFGEAELQELDNIS